MTKIDDDDDLALTGGKKGICFLLKDDANSNGNLEKVKALKPHWNYSWGAPRVKGQPTCMEFIPMIWGGAKTQEAMQQRLEEHVVPQIEAGTCKRLLCFNEPDKQEQSNMSVEQCLAFWPQLEKLGVPLVSPSCANPLGCPQAQDSCQGVSGSWMRDFVGEIEARNWRCDYLGVHWYGGPNPDAFKTRMREIYAAYGSSRPLLITEFAVADWKAMNQSPSDNRFSQERVLDFMKVVLPWIERQEWIAGYAWFPFKIEAPQGTSSALFDADGELTACGRYYRSITAAWKTGNQKITVDPVE